MQKEFYKLVIVFIMIMLAFYLAFFLGRELTLFELENKSAHNKTFSDHQAEEFLNDTSDSQNSPEDSLIQEDTGQRQKVNEYKKLLPLPEDSQLSQESSSDLASSQKMIPESTKPEIYGLLVAKYKDRDAAIDKSSHLKIRFPNWDIFFKLSEDVYKVYIGPFRGQKSAERFLKNLKNEKEFKDVRLEQIISSKPNNELER